MKSNIILGYILSVLLIGFGHSSGKTAKGDQPVAAKQKASPTKKKVAICCSSKIPSRIPAVAFSKPQFVNTSRQ